ncbi:helix-turn-helix domain-containing protein [Paenibacillus sp. S-38]|uniref:helix-turn-helix domain-containing protein n=1 Tax=Paenibacillus sp. S-38 TaxID=3416710 RepID=UPI003CE91A40
MYKLLIADDEAWEREGLELMVSRMMPVQFQFIHAENGRKAIQAAEEAHPDFIFMDIKMPGIQGLDAVKEINRRLPGVRIVLVTAHEYFAYAKEALALGVKDYILKPAKREEIMSLLRRMISELEAEKGKRQEELEIKEKLHRLLPLAENELTLMLLTDSVHDLDCRQLAELFDLRWDRGYAMVISFPFKEQKDWDAFHSRRKEVYESVKQYLKPQLPCLISPMIGSRMAVFIPASPQEAGLSHRVQSLRWGEGVQARMDGIFGLSVRVGIGSLKEGLDGLRLSYQEAAAAAAGSMEEGTVCHADDILVSCRGEQGRITMEEERKLLDSLYRRNREETALYFSQVLDRMLVAAGGNIRMCRDEISAMLISLARQTGNRAPAEILEPFAGVDGSAVLRQTALELMEQMMEEMSREREDRKIHAVERAKLYLAERYSSDISMEQTAEHVNLSPYYFSRIFKLHTGETFVDYLTRLRISEAKRLLEREELSFKEICYEVGYHDPSYFSRIFKKTAGCTPSEYRQQSGRHTFRAKRE